MLSMSTATFGLSARIFLVATRPLVPGMAQSMTTTAGLSCLVREIASSPLLASPTTSIDSSSSRMRRKPRRTRPWSSARRTVILDSDTRRYRHFHADEGAAFGGPQEFNRPAHERRPLAHGNEAETAARRCAGEPRSPIFDVELERAISETQTDSGALRSGMTGDVAQ